MAWALLQHYKLAQRCARHCSDSTSQRAGAHDTAATALFNPRVSTTLRRQYSRQFSVHCIAAVAHDTAATVRLNTQLFATLQRQHFVTRMCSRQSNGSPRHCSCSTSQHAGARDTAATVLFNPQAFTRLQRRSTTLQRPYF